ncbi:MAG TPA: glycosyltransferase [Phycisphaerae bacterium]|nr:glycosyltransferase [Phycisphaerae bacterium]
MARSCAETRQPMIDAMKLLGLGRRPQVLDAGMGAGCLGAEIRAAFPNAEITGVDLWHRFMLDPVCRQTDGWPPLSLYDSLHGGLDGDLVRFMHATPDAAYDVIVMGDVLEHLRPDIAMDVWQRAQAVARAGVIVNIPICDFPQREVWDNKHEVHQWWKPREWWEERGAQHIGGSDRAATFLWRIQPSQAPLLSVVIPTFNRRSYVDLCVRSLLRSEAPPYRYEIIVVDDGSVDGTAEHVRREFGHLNVTCVRRTINAGKPNCPGLARNVGLRAARGEQVAFLDCDVVHCRDIISAMLNQADHDAVWRAHGSWILESHGRPQGTTEFRQGADSEVPAQMWWGTNRELLIEIGGYDERFTVYGAEDQDIYTRLGRHGLVREYLRGMFAVGLYAARPAGSGPKGVIDIEQNEYQHRLWREDESIVRNEGVEWGRAHAVEEQQ